ncbi:MAG: hypothetical protein IJV80_04875 [Clostridia bacterium]|nr:hypothetical protein [Clostridia bacterium]
MKLIDFDEMFDEKLSQFMEENAEKYSERQWEEIIPKLYKKFGDTYVAKVKCTPKEYYEKMTDEELAQTLKAHLEQGVPVPEFLCTEMERRDCTSLLLPLLDSNDESTVSYALHLIADDERAYDKYFTILLEDRVSKDVQDEVTEVFKFAADAVKERALSYYKEGKAKEYMLEILSRVKEKEDEIFKILLEEFRSNEENLPLHASYLAAYGDERALPFLYNRIQDESIGFVVFQELKYAIEALGGEYNESRDFSGDKDYVAVEDARVRSEEVS